MAVAARDGVGAVSRGVSAPKEQVPRAASAVLHGTPPANGTRRPAAVPGLPGNASTRLVPGPSPSVKGVDGRTEIKVPRLPPGPRHPRAGRTPIEAVHRTSTPPSIPDYVSERRHAFRCHATMALVEHRTTSKCPMPSTAARVVRRVEDLVDARNALAGGGRTWHLAQPDSMRVRRWARAPEWSWPPVARRPSRGGQTPRPGRADLVSAGDIDTKAVTDPVAAVRVDVDILRQRRA